MTDEPSDERPTRPRPQYGEYASPEQQAAAAGLPYRPHVGAAPPHGQVPAPLAPPPAVGGVAATAPNRRWDFVLSSLLLGYGLFNVVLGISQYSDLAGLITSQLYAPQGIGTYAASPLTARLGVVIIVGQVILYLITALLTVLRLRAGRIAFWIPLSGGALAGILTAACLLALILPDPAYREWATHAMGG